MLGLTLVFIFLSILYILRWPVAIEPVAWHPPAIPPYEGRFAFTNSLRKAEKLWRGKLSGPESTAIKDGYLYTGLTDGNVVRAPIDGSGEPEVVADTGGHPLGMKFDAAGNLIICDADKGLLCLTPEGEVKVLTDEVEGRQINVADDLDIAPDGKIYFSDISSQYTLAQVDYAIMEDKPLGELICYDPTTKRSRVVLDKLRLANGVAVGPDGDYVLVNQTLGFCVTRLWLKGPKAGQSEPFVPNLPGGPDNITFNGKETYWVALAYPRFPRLEALASRPFKKKLMMRLPRFFALVPEFFNGLNLPTFGLLVGVDMEGNITHFMDAKDNAIGMVTSVLEHEGYLYLGSLMSDYVARIPVPDPI
jgi:sugar lactone lactonase YvrE